VDAFLTIVLTFEPPFLKVILFMFTPTWSPMERGISDFFVTISMLENFTFVDVPNQLSRRLFGTVIVKDNMSFIAATRTRVLTSSTTELHSFPVV
jgi:hypothetical protein